MSRAAKSGGESGGDSRQHSLALDGLRWWSFLGVFLYHANENAVWFGRFGVQVFFVLSGFLIGRILLVLRADDGVSTRARLKAFYGRRVLRIFPLYYFVLLMILVLGSVGILKEPRLEVLPFHALYLTNFYLFFTGAQIDSQTHLWSLAVEEQFYLVAPLVMLRAPFRWLVGGIAALAILNPLLRVENALVWHHAVFEYLTPLPFDMMCLGVATAIIEQKGQFLGVTPARLLRLGGVCGILLGVMIAGFSILPGIRGKAFVVETVFPSLIAVSSAALIYAFWTGRVPRTVAAFFAWAPLVYLGRISYGLYVYHNLLFVLRRIGPLRAHPTEGILASLLATIVIASLSWFLLENPINNLKRFFPYPKSPAKV